jgi:hypothetical protein
VILLLTKAIHNYYYKNISNQIIPEHIITFNMISERESRIRLAEDCKYLTSKLPFGIFDFAHLGVQLSITKREGFGRNGRLAKEIQINKEPLDNHVLLSMFTTPELIELKVNLARHIRLEKEMI